MTEQETTSFTLTQDHIRLLRAAWVGWDSIQAGAPRIDPKRPYGNSDVEYDIAEVLNWTLHHNEDGPTLTDEQAGRLRRLHEETGAALQIVLTTRSFEPGQYERSQPWTKDWHRVDVTPPEAMT
jgi:hypothetical protein